MAAAPPEQVPAHDAGETIAEEWVRPAEALRRHRHGEIELIFPTIRNLQAIARFATSAELLAAAAAAGEVPAILPRIAVDGMAVRILLPGDEGYETAAPGRGGTGGAGGPGGGAAPDFNDVVRAVSLAANEEPAP